MRVPCAFAAKLAMSVAGGQTTRSTAASERAPAMIFSNSAIEVFSPFIFQFAATNGRCAILISNQPLKIDAKACDKQPLADRLRAEKRRFTGSLPSVAAASTHPYSAPP